MTLIHKINRKTIKEYLKITLSLIIPVIIYTSILIIDIPTQIAESIRHGFSWLLIIFAILLYVSYSLRGWLGRTLSLSSTLALFALPLARLWSTGTTEIFSWGGILTWTDSAGYYIYANNILQGLPMVSTIHSARPFFVGILSVFFFLTKLNLQVTISIINGLLGISCFFLAREIQKSYGTSTGVLVVLCLFVFMRPLMGSLMTENLGLCLGVLSLALLLSGARKMSLNISLIGLFVLTIALNTRTGAFFVLPAILVWGCYVFRGSKWISRKFLLGGTSVILLGFILNSVLLKAIGGEDGSSSYGNFSFMFYGVITQTDWMQMFRDYPELNTMNANELENRAYAILWTTIIENPLDSIRGIINEWRKLFFEQTYSIFFIERYRVNQLEFGLRVLASIGLIKCLSKLKQPSYLLIVLYGAGVFFSVPFLAGSFRTYAATIAITPLFSAIGLYVIQKNLVTPFCKNLFKLLKDKKLFPFPSSFPILSTWRDHLAQEKSHQPTSRLDNILPLFSLTLVFLCFIGPIIIKGITKTPNFSGFSCPTGLETVYFRNNPSSSINLISDNEIEDSHFPNLRITDFHNGLKNGHLDWMKEDISKLKKLGSGLTILNHQWIWIVAESDQIAPQSEWFMACGKSATGDNSINLFHADFVKPIIPN